MLKYSAVYFKLRTLVESDAVNVGPWERRQPSAGVIETLKAIHGLIKIVVLSRRTEEEMDDIINEARLHRFVEMSISERGFEHPEPNPDAYLYGLRVDGFTPEQVIVVANCRDSCLAARAAGLAVIAVKASAAPGEDLSAATLVLPQLSAAGFLEALETLSASTA